ncbi:hypothetical protein ACEQ8H_006708 [Pleosporales sp. CAS-2024a]
MSSAVRSLHFLTKRKRHPKQTSLTKAWKYSLENNRPLVAPFKMPLFNSRAKFALSPDQGATDCSYEDVPSPPSRSTSRTRSNSWDTESFPETAYLYPTERNGNWRTQASETMQDPRRAALSVHSAVQLPRLRQTVTCAVESASSQLQTRINRALQGKDVPAMHDKVVGMMPSLALPSKRCLSQGIDTLTDALQSLLHPHSPPPPVPFPFLHADHPADHLAFAHHMATQARAALLAQAICRPHQVSPTRETMPWRTALESALDRLFLDEKEKPTYGLAHLFSLRPVWRPDVPRKTWVLDLETDPQHMLHGTEGGGESAWHKVCLRVVGFGLHEDKGCVRVVGDGEREAVVEDGWVAVQGER